MDIKDLKTEIFDIILERDKLQKKIDEINSLIEQKLQEFNELQDKLQAKINEINSLIGQKLQEFQILEESEENKENNDVEV